jgi:hypothetical protein
VPIHKYNVCENIKWDEIIKAPEVDENSNQSISSQSLVSVAYILTRKGFSDLWNIESVSHNSKALPEQ